MLGIRSTIARAAPGITLRPRRGIDLVLPERPSPPPESEGDDDDNDDDSSGDESDTGGSGPDSGSDEDSDADLEGDAWLAVKDEKARRLFTENPAFKTTAIAELATELTAELADSRVSGKGAMATVVAVIEGGLASRALLPVDVMCGRKNDYIKRRVALELSMQAKRERRSHARGGRR